MRASTVLLATVLLVGCAPRYSLVPPTPVPVARGALKVTPSIAWNKVPAGPQDSVREENWTQNGQMLDGITFIGGLADGEAIARQRPKDERKVPVFRANMTPQDLVSMIESYYRVKSGATIFTATAVEPATFLGKQAVQLSYDYVLSDDVKRRGRMLLAVADGKFYAISVMGTTLHYFDAALPQFETLAGSASIP